MAVAEMLLAAVFRIVSCLVPIVLDSFDLRLRQRYSF